MQVIFSRGQEFGGERGARPQSLCFCLEQPEGATQQVGLGEQVDKGLEVSGPGGRHSVG